MSEIPKTLVEIMQGDRHRTCALTKDSDLRGVTTEGSDVVLHPLHRQDLVLQPEVESATGSSFLSLGETEGPKSVVEADVHDGGAL